VIGLLQPLAYYRLHEQSETGHWGDTLLVKRLIKDMSFQLKDAGNNPLFGKENILFFKRLKYKYFRRLMGYSIKYRKPALAIYAIKKFLT
jgi:hypothetical protein